MSSVYDYTVNHHHDDPDACERYGETIISFELQADRSQGHSQILNANGSQYNVSQAARAAKRAVKNELVRVGYLAARKYLNRPGRTPFTSFDITYMVLYPTARLADADNMFPTIKPLIDGMTKARLWPDDSSRYMKARTYLQSVRKAPAGTRIIEMHIQPIPEGDMS